MMLAIRYGLRKGYQTFEIYGALGGEIGHTIANIQALTFLARQGARGTLMDRHTCVTVIGSGCIRFDPARRGSISIFALDRETRGVTLEGLRYKLADATLTNTFPIGVSNAFIGMEGAVSVREGALLIVWDR